MARSETSARGTSSRLPATRCSSSGPIDRTSACNRIVMTTSNLEIRPTDRIMVLAPHPDDESLAAAGILQRACALGARTRVLFVTDGENNPWAQRAVELRWRIGAADRSRWGMRRRAEALSA